MNVIKNVIKELMDGFGSRRASVEKSLWFFSLGIQQMYALSRASHMSSPWFGNRPGVLKSWAYREWAEAHYPDYEEEYDEK